MGETVKQSKDEDSCHADLGLLLAILGGSLSPARWPWRAWKISSIGGQGGSHHKGGWYWSSLWRACFTDSSSTSTATTSPCCGRGRYGHY